MFENYVLYMASSSTYAFFHCHYAFQKFPFFYVTLCVCCILQRFLNRESCRKLFVELKILPLTSQYIFSLLLFVVKARTISLQTAYFMIVILDIEMIYTCPRQHWLRTKKGPIIRVKIF